MRRRTAVLLSAMLVIGMTAGCTRFVGSTATPAPPTSPSPVAPPTARNPVAPPNPTGLPAEPNPTAPNPTPPNVIAPNVIAPNPAVPNVIATAPGPRSRLNTNAVVDECLLNAAQLAALVGEPVTEPRMLTVRHDDGPARRSCSANTARGESPPVVMINVYTVQTGTPADYLRATPPAARSDLFGLGEAAAIIETPEGPVLQVASHHFLVTIIVLDRKPSADRWRAAGEQALAQLPS